MNLRPYQQEAVDSIYGYFEKYRGNPLVVVPTGGGKSVILSEFVRRVLTDSPRERILLVTHVKELIAQNHASLMRMWPEAPAGIYSAGLRKREHNAQVLFCGIQSVYDKADKLGWADLILVDEAHLIPARGFGMYRRLLEDLKRYNQHLKVIGLTATPYRTDSGSLTTGEDPLFNGIAYDCEVAKLIADGYLSNITARGGRAKIDTSNVHLRGGEFIDRELQAAATSDDIVQRAVSEIVERGADRKSWLIFCCGISHAQMVADELRARNVTVGEVYGDTSHDERDAILVGFKSGEIRAVVNVGVLTTGFDAPATDLIALMRPTMSPGLYVQMVGRGLRLAPGKTDCLILDFGGNVVRHGPIDQVQIREPGSSSGSGEAPAKECPGCQMLVAVQYRECPECGYEFPQPIRVNHADRADDVAILSTQAEPTIVQYQVIYTSYRLWQSRPEKPPTMRVDYECTTGESRGFALTKTVSEWVCLQHDLASFPQRKARSWWMARGGSFPPPTTIMEALNRQHELRQPSAIMVDLRGEYPQVVSATVPREPGDDDAIGSAPAAASISEKPPF